MSKVPDSTKKASTSGVDKESESELLLIAVKYKLTPLQRKCIQVLLESTPYDSFEVLAEKAKTSTQNLCYLRTQHKRFRAALHESVLVLIGTDWPVMIKAVVERGKAGELKEVQWLSELAGFWTPTSKIDHSHKGNLSLTIEKVTKITGPKK